jgi:two-component system, OmpR family, response regulator
MRVLYIDDDRVNAILFAEACRFAPGVEVQTSFSGAEAQDLVQQWAPDLLVIDLHLPDTDGYQLLPALRTLLQRPHLPAYLCTADETGLVQGPARAAGFDGCWAKPVDLQFVMAELARLAALAAAP